MSISKLCITDSGGIQEEAPSFNLPIIVTRSHTERIEGINAGCSVLVGTKKESIINNFEKIMKNENIYKKMSQSTNPYGDGFAAKQIVDLILEKNYL